MKTSFARLLSLFFSAQLLISSTSSAAGFEFDEADAKMIISELKASIEIPEKRDQLLIDLLIFESDLFVGAAKLEMNQFRDTTLAKHFNTLPGEKRDQLYLKAYRKSVDLNGTEKSVEIFMKATDRNHELGRQFICSALRDLGRSTRGFHSEDFKDNASRMEPILPVLIRDPSLLKERCNFEGDDQDLQIQQIVNLAIPDFEKNLKTSGVKKSEASLVAAESVTGCSETDLGFLIRRSMANLKKTKVGTDFPVDESYNQCHIKGILKKVSDASYVFIAGYDVKKSPRTGHFDDSNQAVRLMLPFQKKASVAQSETSQSKRLPVASPNAGEKPVQGTFLSNPHGAAR